MAVNGFIVPGQDDLARAAELGERADEIYSWLLAREHSDQPRGLPLPEELSVGLRARSLMIALVERGVASAPDDATAGPLEDVFSGHMELTASERAYLKHAVQELYMNGGWAPKGVDRREIAKRVFDKLGSLRLTQMVSPDGSRLVSVAEHDAIVAEMKRPK